MKNYPTVLTIAGFDSSNFAGIGADIKTISALSGFAFGATTAITAQNSKSVTSIVPVPSDMVSSQIESVFRDFKVNAVKIGMLFSKEIVMAVADSLEKFCAKNIVIDTVIKSTTGKELLSKDAVDALQKRLFPMAKLITPNIPEAKVLLGGKLAQKIPPKDIVKKLSLKYNVNVLLKGGHSDGELCTDYLYIAKTNSLTELSETRIHTKNSRGTGCTLSSAIATFLAEEYSLIESTQKAKEYISKILNNSNQYVRGSESGALNHFTF